MSLDAGVSGRDPGPARGPEGPRPTQDPGHPQTAGHQPAEHQNTHGLRRQ